jgi:serine/threonine protein kinase
MGNLPKDIKEHFFSNKHYRGMRLKNINDPVTLDKLFTKYFNPVEMKFLKGLLDPSPGDRLTAKQALMHEYFDNMRAKDPEFGDIASTKHTINSPANITMDKIPNPNNYQRYDKPKISIYEVLFSLALKIMF